VTEARERSPALEVLRVNLIVARVKAGLSQDDLAERSCVSRPTISRIERAASDEEIERRARAGDNEYVSARDLFAAIDEAGQEGIQRYSHAGRRPAMARRPAQRRR
jgi:transcriptional regulator with XRE-family HTH domain